MAIRSRLPAQGAYGWLSGPLGRAVVQPWFDSVAFATITRGLLPMSRAWAAAEAAAGSRERFAEAIPEISWRPSAIDPILRRVAARREAYLTADQQWRRIFFAPEAQDPAGLVAAETARLRRAHALMTTKVLFTPWLRALPRTRFDIALPDTVMARHGGRLKSLEAAFPHPQSLQVEASHPVPGARAGAPAQVRWLRCPSPELGDTAWARVDEPEGRDAAATVISLHGIMIEGDMLRGLLDPLTHRLPAGVRIIRPEAPWHARRRLDGWYGGEPIMGWGPMGLVSGFAAALPEVAAWIRWARGQGSGPVVLAGVSLGALTAQLYAAAARTWPPDLAPDALYLVATSGDVGEVALDGCLAQVLDIRKRLEEAGWTDQKIEPWLPLIQPSGPPALPPERIFLRVGERDCVAPPEGALNLARSWSLPESNLFQIPRLGHFSIALGLLADIAPWRQIFERLEVAV